MAETEKEGIIKKCLQFVPPALPLLLLSFARSATATVLKDLIMYRTCLVTLNLGDTPCHMLRTNSSNPEAQKIEAEVQSHSSMIIMTDTLIESLLTAGLSLFLGPWSDRGGRKPLLVAGFAGFTIMFALLALLSNWNISPWYLVIPTLLTSMLGGFAAIIFASLCYVSDTAIEKYKTMLLACLQSTIICGTLLGIFTGPLIYKKYGFIVTFTFAAMCCALALLYTYFFIPETVKDTSKESIAGLFKMSHAKELIASAILKRDGFHRDIVWLGLFVAAVWLLIIHGEGSIEYLFTRQRLGWEVQHYSNVVGIAMVVNVAGLLCGVSILSLLLGLPDTLVGIIGLISGIGSAITKSLVLKDWHMYLALGINACSGVLAPVVRSILSKAVPPQDLGKVFSLTVSLETLSPLASAPLYSIIYSNYQPPIYPSPVYLISASFFLVLLFAVVWIEVLSRMSRRSTYSPTSQVADDDKFSE